MSDLRILIVEDNLTFAINLEAHFVEWGYEVMGIVDNSEDALESIMNNKPDIVVMDINIKGDRNGIEVTQEISYLDIFVIYITAERDSKTYNLAAETQGVSYLIKPFDMLTLKGTIELAIPKWRNQQLQVDSEKYPVFFIKKRKELIKINTRELNWVHADGNYCDLHFKNRKEVLRTSLRKLLMELPEDKFIRTHNKYAVRIDAIEGVFLTSNKLKVDGHLLLIGRNFKKELLKKINRV